MPTAVITKLIPCWISNGWGFDAENRQNLGKIAVIEVFR